MIFVSEFYLICDVCTICSLFNYFGRNLCKMFIYNNLFSQIRSNLTWFLQALIGLHELTAAKQCFESVLKYEPNNRAAITKINECDNKLKCQQKLEKSVYSNMFEKFAKRDSKLCLDFFCYLTCWG